MSDQKQYVAGMTHHLKLNKLRSLHRETFGAAKAGVKAMTKRLRHQIKEEQMTHAQLKIKLSATKSSLVCLERCMAQSHRLPLEDGNQMRTDAKAKIHEIKRLEKVIADAVP